MHCILTIILCRWASPNLCFQIRQSYSYQHQPKVYRWLCVLPNWQSIATTLYLCNSQAPGWQLHPSHSSFPSILLDKSWQSIVLIYLEPRVGFHQQLQFFLTPIQICIFFFYISKSILLGMMYEVLVTFWYMITTVRRMEKSVDLLKYICVNGWLPVKWNQADVGSWLDGSFMVTCQLSTSQ